MITHDSARKVVHYKTIEIVVLICMYIRAYILFMTFLNILCFWELAENLVDNFHVFEAQG